MRCHCGQHCVYGNVYIANVYIHLYRCSGSKKKEGSVLPIIIKAFNEIFYNDRGSMPKLVTNLRIAHSRVIAPGQHNSFRRNVVAVANH